MTLKGKSQLKESISWDSVTPLSKCLPPTEMALYAKYSLLVPPYQVTYRAKIIL
jgi:hypothetical protein